MFKYLRSCQIFFQNDCTNLHSHQQCMNFFTSSPILIFYYYYYYYCHPSIKQCLVFSNHLMMHFSNHLMMFSIFSCAYQPFVCLLKRNNYLNLLLILKLGYLSFYFELYVYLCVLGIRPLLRFAVISPILQVVFSLSQQCFVA